MQDAPMVEAFDDISCSELLARGDTFLQAVADNPSARPVVGFFAEAQESLRRALQKRKEACAASEEAYRACDLADLQLDEIIADLSLAALDQARGDTRDSLFSRLFPEGPQAVTSAPVALELQLVRELRERLDGHPLQERYDRQLAADAAMVEKAEQALSAALDVEARAWADCRKAEMAWRLRARLAHATLQRLLRNEGQQELLATIDRLLPPVSSGDVAALRPARP